LRSRRLNLSCDSAVRTFKSAATGSMGSAGAAAAVASVDFADLPAASAVFASFDLDFALPSGAAAVASVSAVLAAFLLRADFDFPADLSEPLVSAVEAVSGIDEDCFALSSAGAGVLDDSGCGAVWSCCATGGEVAGGDAGVGAAGGDAGAEVVVAGSGVVAGGGADC